MAVAATGFFDGVHLGHRVVLDKVKVIAEECGLESAVVTFWPHPRIVLEKDADALRLLTSVEEKTSIIKDCGISRVIIIPFTPELSRLRAEDFLRILVRDYGISTLVIGYDHAMGADNVSGALLSQLVSECGMTPVETGRYDEGSVAVSSSKIRMALESGDIGSADAMLGYRYMISGVLEDGGAVRPHFHLKMIPKEGEYDVTLRTRDKEGRGRCVVSENCGNRRLMLLPAEGCSIGKGEELTLFFG